MIVAEDHNLIDKSNRAYFSKSEVTTHIPYFKCWSFVTYEIIIWMSVMVMRGNNSKINWGWYFDPTFIQIISKW